MVMSAGKLGSHRAITSGTYSVYQCTTGNYAKAVINVIGELTGEASVKLFISPTNSPLATHTIHLDNLNSIKKGFTRTGIILKSDEWISYSTTAEGVTVTVSGVEYPTDGKEVSANQLISTDTEVLLYECPASTVATINAVVSGTGEAVTSSVVAKLYITNTNASGGSLLMVQNINSGETGFEYSGIILSAGQKLVMVTTNIIGNIATKVHGFTRAA